MSLDLYTVADTLGSRSLPAVAAPPGKLGYHAIASTPRRAAPTISIKAEDDELDAAGRAKLVTTTRDLRRNFEVAAWAVRKHLDYVSTFNFQVRTRDEAWNQAVENRFVQWSRPAACDVRRMHPFWRLVRICEALRTIDGDALAVKLAAGQLQIVEGDRVRTPVQRSAVKLDKGFALVHGFVVDEAGAPVAYSVCKRAALANAFEFERLVPADNAFVHGYYDRYDQVRGVSPLAAAVNRFVDVYENFEYALARAKVLQLFGLKITRSNSDAFPTAAPAEGDGTPTGSPYEVDFGKGPFLLDMEVGDDASLLESQQPSPQFQAFTQIMIAVALKALDIPMSFYQENYSTYSGSRQAWIQYEQSAQQKRRDLRLLLDAVTRWKLVSWVADGSLGLPAGLSIDDVKWEWVAAGVPWIDPLKEVQADLAACNGGLDSEISILKGLGKDYRDVLRERAEFLRVAAEMGVPIGTPQPIPIPADPPPANNQGQE